MASAVETSERIVSEESTLPAMASASSQGSLVLDVLRQVFFGFVGAMMVITAYDLTRDVPPKIVTVDLSSYLSSKKQQYLDQVVGSKTLTKDEMIIKTNRLASAVDEVLQAAVAENNIILVPKEAVFAGNAPDYTSMITDQIEQKLSDGQALSMVSPAPKTAE